MPNSKGRRRRFGAVRELHSGQWQARYRGPDGIMRPADRTFRNKTAAERWLTTKEAEILNGDWLDPDAGRTPFGIYATAWIEERPNLRPSTVKAYQSVLRHHLIPAFGAPADSKAPGPASRRNGLWSPQARSSS